MNYSIELTAVALHDIEKHKKSGNKKIILKINNLLNELRVTPYSGTGKAEKLKYYDHPTWSRRISSKHRLVYRVSDEKLIVLVLSLWGHYGDK